MAGSPELKDLGLWSMFFRMGRYGRERGGDGGAIAGSPELPVFGLQCMVGLTRDTGREQRRWGSHWSRKERSESDDGGAAFDGRRLSWQR